MGSVATPHINRLSSLFIYRSPQGLQDLLDHFQFPAPLLKELRIVIDDGAFGSEVTSITFPEDLSPLHRLSLSGVTTLPWKHLSNFTEFQFMHPQREVGSPFIAQLLDFFESAPLLRAILLRFSIPNHFSVSPDRVVPLPNLERLNVGELPGHSTFFNHLSIPTGASLDLRFDLSEYVPRIPVCLDNNFGNLHDITTIDLFLGTPSWALMQLSGPSGELRISGRQARTISPIIQSLCKFDLSKTQMLSVMGSNYIQDDRVQESSIFQYLPLMEDLRTLTLMRVDHRPFIRALNPKENDSRTVLYSQLEELVLYFRSWDQAYIKELVEMVSERAKRRSKLSSITIFSLDVYCPREVSLLKKYVSHVEYKLESSPSCWDIVTGGSGSCGFNSGWHVFPFDRGYGGDDDDDIDDGSWREGSEW